MQSLPWDQLIKQAENAGGGDPVPASQYQVTVASAEAKPSSTGKPMVKVKATINGGAYDGKVLWTQHVVSQESDVALSIFFRQMAAYGLDKAYFASNPSWEQVAKDIVGRSVVFDVSVGSYQGRPKNNVDDVKPASAVPSLQAQAPTAPVPQVPAPAPQIPTALESQPEQTPAVPNIPTPQPPKAPF